MIKSDSVQDSFWSNHKDVSNSITYEHLRQLPLNNERRPYRSTSRDFHNLKKNEVVMCLNSPTLPFLPCFITFCSTHSYTSYFYEIFATCNICDSVIGTTICKEKNNGWDIGVLLFNSKNKFSCMSQRR